MGHSDSMSPPNGGAPTLSCTPPHEDNAAANRLAVLEKPTHHDNPVEPVRVKLRGPVGYPNESLWLSEELNSRSSPSPISQAISQRQEGFASRVLRVQSSSDTRSGRTTPPSESDEDEVAVDNQKEDQQVEGYILSQNSRPKLASTSSKLASRCALPMDNQDSESQSLCLDLIREDINDRFDNNFHSANIWSNPNSGFNGADFNLTVSPTASPDRFGSGRSATFSRPSSMSSTVVPIRQQSGDNSACTGSCRVPPGMSLIDRIQEDFPRTPSPEFGQFDDGGATSTRSLDVWDHRNQATFGLNEGIETWSLYNNQFAPVFDLERRSVRDFPQHMRGPRFTGGNGDPRHTLSRRTSEPPFCGPYHGAQGFRSTYAWCGEGYPVLIADPKSSWAINDDLYCFPSQFEVGQTESASSYTGYDPVPSYAVGYPGECRGIRSSDRMLKTCQTYPLMDHLLYESQDVRMCQRSQLFHRPKVGTRRQSELDFLYTAAHSYTSSSLLEEFNLTPKAERWGLSEIRGHLFIFAKDQTGSRFIQQKLEKADERLRADVFSEIFPNSLLLMTDVFGNYVIQKLLEYGSREQQRILVELMTSNMISLALQVYGCRVIQRAFEVTPVDEQLALIRQLKGYVSKCVVDQNGNHVLQKCIEAASWKKSVDCIALGRQRFVTGEDIQFIIDSFVGHAAALSTHSYGCRVIQRVLEHCAPVQIRPLLNEIIYKCRDLVKDQFGNYVVQHVISHGEADQRNIVMQTVLPEIALWSQHKYASNVVETCLEHATKEEITQIVDFILQRDENGSTCALLPMMKHMYGNYVVQKLLERADDHDRQRIKCIVRHNEDYLKRFTFGKHVLSRLKREE